MRCFLFFFPLAVQEEKLAFNRQSYLYSKHLVLWISLTWPWNWRSLDWYCKVTGKDRAKGFVFIFIYNLFLTAKWGDIWCSLFYLLQIHASMSVRCWEGEHKSCSMLSASWRYRPSTKGQDAALTKTKHKQNIYLFRLTYSFLTDKYTVYRNNQ